MTRPRPPTGDGSAHGRADRALRDGVGTDLRFPALLVLSAAIGAVTAAIMSTPPVPATGALPPSDRTRARDGGIAADDGAWAELKLGTGSRSSLAPRGMLGQRDRAEDVAQQLFGGARAIAGETAGRRVSSGGSTAWRSQWPRSLEVSPRRPPRRWFRFRPRSRWSSRDRGCTTSPQIQLHRNSRSRGARSSPLPCSSSMRRSAPRWCRRCRRSWNGIGSYCRRSPASRHGSCSAREVTVVPPFLLALIVLLCAFAPGEPPSD